MGKQLGSLIIMIVVLTGCQSTGVTPDLFEEGNSSLPASWTIEVSKSPSLTETPGLDVDEIPSPTPDFLPPSLSPSPEAHPTKLAFTYQALPDLKSGKYVSIQQIKMATTEKGWAIGGQNDEFHYILFSLDGGHSWQDRTPPILVPSEFQRNIDNIIAHFYDENTAWVLIDITKDNLNDSNYLVWRTEDSGLTWILPWVNFTQILAVFHLSRQRLAGCGFKLSYPTCMIFLTCFQPGMVEQPGN